MLQSCPELPVYPQKSRLNASDWKINSLAHKNCRQIVSPGNGKVPGVDRCVPAQGWVLPRQPLLKEMSGSWGLTLDGKGGFKNGPLDLLN